MSRYNGRDKAINSNEMYKNTFEDRGVKEIEQFRTPELSFPSREEEKRITTINYVWRQGDRYWRLAAKQYGDPNLWWVIAQFNKKPTEGHLSPGDTIKIPIDLSVVLGAML